LRAHQALADAPHEASASQGIYALC